MSDSVVRIYTDGSCPLKNPGPGGWAAILIYEEYRTRVSGFEADATNNRMELMAAIEALNSLTRPCRVIVYTDSRYVQRGITEWLPKWKRNRWRNSAGKQVANQDLWKKLVSAQNKHEQVVWRWIRGHSGHPENEEADRLACEVVMKRIGLIKPQNKGMEV